MPVQSRGRTELDRGFRQRVLERLYVSMTASPRKDADVQRTAVNPWPWSQQYGFNQGELIESHQRLLFCSGQTAVDADGNPQHVGDMAAQLTLALDNLDAVLAGGGMSLVNVVRVTTYTTDVDGLLPHYGIFAERLAKAGVMPASTLVGVARLAFPELLVEIKATAVQ